MAAAGLAAIEKLQVSLWRLELHLQSLLGAVEHLIPAQTEATVIIPYLAPLHLLVEVVVVGLI